MRAPQPKSIALAGILSMLMAGVALILPIGPPPVLDVTKTFSLLDPALLDAPTCTALISRIRLQWPGRAGGSYSVQRRDEISDWTEIARLIAVVNEEISVSYDLGTLDTDDQWRVIEP